MRPGWDVRLQLPAGKERMRPLVLTCGPLSLLGCRVSLYVSLGKSLCFSVYVILDNSMRVSL